MDGILNLCNDIYKQQPCCHTDGRPCSCEICLYKSFYSKDPDTYNCLKKLCYYTMNYGPAYASEIYHFLSDSRMLEDNFNGRSLNVVSLGCGFSPDFIALDKYIDDKNLNIEMRYLGIDNEPLWDRIRNSDSRARFRVGDVLSGFNLAGYDLLFINKLYSTLKQNQEDRKFIGTLVREIKNSMSANSFLVFDDVNLYKKGRDEFDSSIRSYFTVRQYYYFPIDRAYTGSYTKLSGTTNMFHIPPRLAVSPKLDVTKTVIFVYKK